MFGDKIPDELKSLIDGQKAKNKKVYEALKALTDSDADSEIFRIARNAIFTVKNGNADNRGRSAYPEHYPSRFQKFI
jgi:hypothetical protein